ncbi:site-2 protease family protein [Patescibacteria group bacterium]|jgi:Zn-dependent protease|nr:site-2 protease family protein [Patescibacteria group bacterium]
MGLISLLSQEPVVFVVLVAALVFTLSIHEAAHAWVGYLLGDSTAKRMGRLTINPLAHLDPVGFLMILFAGFGYAKPVPFNPYNLRDQRWGPALIAAAGPGSNLIFGILCAVAYGLVASRLGSENLLSLTLWFLGHINFALMAFNLIPLPPLDGSKALLAVLAAPKFEQTRRFLETQGPSLLLLLIILDIVLNIGVFSWIFWISNGLFSLFG